VAEPDGLPGDSWYFDPHARTLAYRVGKYTCFDLVGGTPNGVEFKVVLVYDDHDGESRVRRVARTTSRA
jgi:hypothetical protein